MVGYNHRRTRRGVRREVALPVLKNFRANSVFRASAGCSKILNDKNYFNTVNNLRATLVFRASASCSKILNDIKYIFNTVNSGHSLLAPTWAPETLGSQSRSLRLHIPA